MLYFLDHDDGRARFSVVNINEIITHFKVWKKINNFGLDVSSSQMSVWTVPFRFVPFVWLLYLEQLT